MYAASLFLAAIALAPAFLLAAWASMAMSSADDDLQSFAGSKNSNFEG